MILRKRQFINVAVAEKLSALRTEDYFPERRSRADTGAAKLLLKKAGTDEPARAGDDLGVTHRRRVSDAPVRLVVPFRYGNRSIKAIESITLAVPGLPPWSPA